MVILQLIYEFFFIGLFAVGGGLATIPFLQSLGLRRGWYSGAQLANMIATSEVVPGPIGTNMAAYVGFTVGGIPGGLLSPLALMIPTFVIDLIAARLMERFRESKQLEQVMRVLRPVSAGLICAAAVALLKLSLASGNAWLWNSPLSWLQWFDWRYVLLYAALLPFVLWKKTKKIHPAVYIAVGAAVGVLFKF